MNTEAVGILSKIEPFSRLPGEAVEAVAAQAALMTFPSGTVLAEQARTTLDQIYIVRSGQLELFFESRGEKKPAACAGARRYFRRHLHPDECRSFHSEP